MPSFSVVALALALEAAAAQPAAPTSPTGTDGVQLSVGLGYPQTMTVGAGYRRGAFGVVAEYQPPVDQTFLDTSVDLAVRGYFPPVDASWLFKANGQVFVGLAAGSDTFAQTASASATDNQGHVGTDTVRTTVNGTFVAPHVGFQLYDGQGHQLETDLGWFKPVGGSSTSTARNCQGAPALCDQAQPNVPIQPAPAYMRTSGFRLTLIRYVWSL